MPSPALFLFVGTAFPAKSSTNQAAKGRGRPQRTPCRRCAIIRWSAGQQEVQKSFVHSFSLSPNFPLSKTFTCEQTCPPCNVTEAINLPSLNISVSSVRSRWINAGVILLAHLLEAYRFITIAWANPRHSFTERYVRILLRFLKTYNFFLECSLVTRIERILLALRMTTTMTQSCHMIPSAIVSVQL
jgi:hypothetical protein